MGDSDPGSIDHVSSAYQRLVATPPEATSGSTEADTQIAEGVGHENFSSEGFVSDSASVRLESTQEAEHAVTSSLAAQDAAYSSDGDNSAVEAYQVRIATCKVPAALRASSMCLPLYQYYRPVGFKAARVVSAQQFGP